VYHGESGIRTLRELSRSYLTVSKDLTNVGAPGSCDEGAPIVANRDQTSGQRKVVVIQTKRDDCEFNGKQQPHEGQPAEKVKTGNLADSQGCERVAESQP
jgi:hypothetical protein